MAIVQASDRIGTHLVREAPGMRIWHIRLAPDEVLPMHRHDRPYFWTVMTDGQGHGRYADGREAEISYRAGDTQYFPDLSGDNRFAHELTNVGEQDLLFVTVEFDQAPTQGAKQ